MSIQVDIASVDRTDHIVLESLAVEQVMTNQVDSAQFTIRKYGSRTYAPSVGDDVYVYDGATKIFGGEIVSWDERVESGGGGIVYDIKCVDWTYLFDSQLVSASYESETIEDIIDDIVSNFTDGSFTTIGVTSTFVIDSIVFNQVKPSECLKRLAKVVNYNWYIDPDKDINFFAKFTNTAPFNLTDTSGNYIYKKLEREIDGTQLANTVVVRGGEYNGDTYTDDITVSGDDSKSFLLPYKFANLTVQLDTGGGFVSQDIGIDFIDDFGASVDVLYNYNDKTIRWQSALADGDIIRFSGNPKIPVLATAQDPLSVAEFGVKSRFIRDTSIEDLTTARQRAKAEVNVYKDEIEDAKFETYTSGLRTGMYINLTSTLRTANTDFLIRKVKAQPVDPNNFVYKVDLVTTAKYELVELLQSLLQPEPRQADASEVAEIIKIDTAIVSIAESILAVVASEDDATVTITEDIRKDPLGANTEPDWVLAPYLPSPWPTDTKREGRVDYSMEVY